MNCRHCNDKLQLSFVDLGSAPPSNAYLTEKKLHDPEKWYPLRVLVCKNCWLVQTEDFTQANELFDKDYAYFSGFSTSWLEHSEKYVVNMVERFNLNEKSHVVEVAANDGYLLQYVKARKIPCTGIEPTNSTAQVAREKGIDIVEVFFGVALAKKLVDQGKQADLTVANNVLAHVPDINDFVAGFAFLLKPNGVSTFEFHHLMQLVADNQFDTIYHEHFSYLSLTSVQKIFNENGLDVFDVEELFTHGGSLRVFAQRKDTGTQEITQRVKNMLLKEEEAGIKSEHYYKEYQIHAEKAKNDFLEFLIKAKKEGRKVAAYGAAAKGNTFINYAGIRSDLIKFVVDRNPAKEGKFMPGSRIPIVNESFLKEEKPDYIVILPWNLKAEISEQLSYSRNWGAKFVVAIPKLMIND
jgi:ubiquinone/menaquinone biosynthesis C-methylase UbiE